MSTVHFRIHLTPSCSIGPGKIDLLEAVGRVGSIRQAARSMGMSYRRAWLLLDSLNRSFSESIIRACVGGAGGGGVVVTEFGADLIRHYRVAAERVETLARAEFADIAKKALQSKKGGVRTANTSTWSEGTADAGAGTEAPARQSTMPRKKSGRRKPDTAG